MIIPKVGDKPANIRKSKVRSDLWDMYYPHLANENQTVLDDLAIANFIGLLELYNSCSDHIDQNGLVYESTDKFGKELQKINPSYKAMSETSRNMVAYYQRFGMTNWDRNLNDKRFNTTVDLERAEIEAALAEKFCDT